MVSTAAFHARVRGSVPGLGGLKKTKMFLPHPRVKVSIVGSRRDREVACSASDSQGSNIESCVWRTVSSQSSHHPQEVLLAQFSLYVHKGGLKPDSFHFYRRQILTTEFAKIANLSILPDCYVLYNIDCWSLVLLFRLYMVDHNKVVCCIFHITITLKNTGSITIEIKLLEGKAVYVFNRLFFHRN